MKHAKKLASLLLALVMVLSLATTSFADETGTITVDNAVVDQTYTIYRILDLESYDKTAGTYSYKAATAWSAFINSTGIKGTYVEVDDQGYVTWKDGADPADFAKAAQKYAKDNSIGNQGSKTATSTTVTFDNLALGYYLLDTSLGSLCSLNTTNPTVTIQEKNEAPTVDKEVKEDSTGNYGESNTAQTGDTVEFKITVHAKKGAQNYVLHDEMDAALALNTSSVKVYVGSVTAENALAEANYTLKTTGFADTCDFEITFSNDYLATITSDTDIIVTYTAVLNGAADSNINKAKLDYGDNSSTEWDPTETKTLKFDIIKTDSNKKVLPGAKFELYDAQTSGNKINLVKEADGTYRVAIPAEAADASFTSAVIEAGTATVKGLDANTTYWLEETEAPAGYNKLSGRQEVKMEDESLTTTMTGDTWADGDGGVQITNRAGTLLPSTGGIGTTIFYVVGSVLVLAAVVLLVVKKRMSMKE